MIVARNLAPNLRTAAGQSPVLELTGPRHSGKTTMVRSLFPQHAYISLEDPEMRAFARYNAREFLKQLSGGAIIDEVQYVPDLLSYIQVIVDEEPLPGSWILTGSYNFSLMRSIKQSLAGRTSVHRLLPLTWDELTQFSTYPSNLEEALFTGGFTRIFEKDENPYDCLRFYVGDYLERDVRSVRNIGDICTFQYFVELCAGRSGSLLNYSALAKDCGITQPTAKSWITVLQASYVLFQVQPFRSNLRKRIIKIPKLYFYDSGLMCWLLGIRAPEQIRSHPLRGKIFETWVVAEIMKHNAHSGGMNRLYFYRGHNGAEVDLVNPRPDKITIIEAKSATTPSPKLVSGTKRIRRHFELLSLPLDCSVVYGGNEFQKFGETSVIPWRALRFPLRHSRRIGVQNGTVTISVLTGNNYVFGVEVLAFFPNKTWVSASTDEQGIAQLKLHSMNQPMVVYVATSGFAAHLETDWIPAERDLHIELEALPGGGSVIFPNAIGHVPGLSGRLNPKLVTQNRICLDADNIAIDGGKQQPVDIVRGEILHLMDAQGYECNIRIIEILNRSVLLEYQPI